MILGEHVTLDAGTGAVHTAPGARAGGLRRRRSATACRSTIRWAATAASARHAAGRGPEGRWRRTPSSSRRSSERGAAAARRSRYVHSYPHCWRHKTPVIFRATPQWFISMEQQRLRAHALRDIKQVRWTPAWGEQRITGMIDESPGLVHLAPAHLGRADRAVRAQGDRRAASAHAGAASKQWRRASSSGGIDAWFALDAGGAAGRGGRATTRRSRTSWTCGPTRACRSSASARCVRRFAAPGRSVPGRLGPASRLVPQLAADVRGAVRARALSRRAHARLHGG